MSWSAIFFISDWPFVHLNVRIIYVIFWLAIDLREMASNHPPVIFGSVCVRMYVYVLICVCRHRKMENEERNALFRSCWTQAPLWTHLGPL